MYMETLQQCCGAVNISCGTDPAPRSLISELWLRLQLRLRLQLYTKMFAAMDLHRQLIKCR
jgi:hypothetical protein